MKAIVVGASGYIGHALYHQASRMFDAYGTTSATSKLDSSFLKLRLDKPDEFNYDMITDSDIVFLTAAISAPDICANEHARAWEVNVTGTIKFINHVIARRGRIIFFSSDTVYGERNDVFDENAECKPSGEYAEMKHAVEMRFLGNPLFKALRLSYVFSCEDKFTKYLIGCATRNEEADLFHPFYRAIVHRDDVVQGALELAKKWDEFPHQVINMGGPEVLSRVEFAECLKRSALPDLRYRVTEPGDDFFKNRPRVIAMTSNLLPKLLDRPARSLAETVQIEFANNRVV